MAVRFWPYSNYAVRIYGSSYCQAITQYVFQALDTAKITAVILLGALIDDTIEDAHQILRLTTERQQTLIGAMAIYESRRSIKEAVSVKRLTQLAFVFIPLSYVSSLFGMNITEMSGNGPRLWVFLVTSFSLLIGALSFWGLSPKVEATWTQHMKDRSPSKISAKTQVRILYSSLRTGNFIWMIRSGVFLGLLTQNIFGDKENTYNKAHAKFFGDWFQRRQQRHENSVV